MKESSSTHDDKEFHGCISAFLHLFDFNQGLTPRKILPPRKCCEEMEAPKSTMEKPGGETQCGIDNSVEKKRMSNVVARLMGLEVMPSDRSTSGAASVLASANAKQGVGISVEHRNPLTLSRSRSVNTLSKVSSDPLTPNVDQNLQFRSRSFREHHPQEKELEEFKRDFEASQMLRPHHGDHSHHGNLIPQRSDDASGLLLKDKLTDLKRSTSSASGPGPARTRRNQNQSKEFLDALEYLQKNERIFVRALHDPNSLLARQTHPRSPEYKRKISFQERPSVKQLGSPRRFGSLRDQHNELIPVPVPLESPSKNSVNPVLAKIVVLKPNSGNAKHIHQKLKSSKGESTQCSNGTFSELRNSRDVPQKRVKKIKEDCRRKISKELDFEEESGSVSDSSCRVRMVRASSHNISAKGDQVLSSPRKVSGGFGKSSPGVQSPRRFRKDMAETIKEEDKASARQQHQCPMGSDKKKLSSKPCTVTRRNADVHDRIARVHSSSGKYAADPSKKTPCRLNFSSKVNHESEKGTLALANDKERKMSMTEESENAKVFNADDFLINSENEIESSSYEESPVGNRDDVASVEVLDGTAEKCEFPSPVSVFDGPFQHESPILSPVNMKEITTDFHDLTTKLCSLKLNREDPADSDQYGHIHHELTLELTAEDRLISPKKEVLSDKRWHSSEIQSSIFESLRVDGIVLSERKEADFLYVRNVLVSAGLNDENILAFTRWYTPSHPIDPQVFYQLEEYYHDVQGNTSYMNSSSGSQGYENLNDKVNQKLLFELVNEILCKRLKPFLKTRAWINPVKQNLRYMSTGKQLLKEVWDEICRYPAAACEIMEDVESLVHGDIASEAPWAGDDEDIEKVGCEVEQYIFDYLLQEAVFDLLSA